MPIFRQNIIFFLKLTKVLEVANLRFLANLDFLLYAFCFVLMIPADVMNIVELFKIKMVSNQLVLYDQCKLSEYVNGVTALVLWP